MEGPTPVSALIHAATMVAAGVYMLCRVFFLLDVPGSHALEVIAWIGGFTAPCWPPSIAVQQNDASNASSPIPRCHNWATWSMAVGLGGPDGGDVSSDHTRLLQGHAVPGRAGSVIYGAASRAKRIWKKMGALKKKMPVTYWTFMAGTLALCGVPPLSGFYSKDGILAQAVKQSSYGLFALGVVVALLTTFYMFRLAYVVFGGGARSAAPAHAHESPGVMIWPLRILAVFSMLIGGLIGIASILYAKTVSNRGRREHGGLGFRRNAIVGAVQCPAPLAAIFRVCSSVLFGVHACSALLMRSIAARSSIPCRKSSAGSRGPPCTVNWFYCRRIRTRKSSSPAPRRRWPRRLGGLPSTAGLISGAVVRGRATEPRKPPGARCCSLLPERQHCRPTPSCSSRAWRWCLFFVLGK